MPDVSVIIPTYNRAKFLPQAIQSVIEQTFTEFEIVVIDDGSVDETRSIVQDLQKKDRRILYIYQENCGHGAARNTGLRNASGEWIATLDSDDLWLPQKLAVQMKAAKEYPGVDFFYCGGIVTDESGNPDPVWTKLLRSDRLYSAEIILFEYAKILTSGVLFRKRCLDKTGMFDESLKFFEDLDLWFRILLFYKGFFINEDLIVKRRHSQSFADTHSNSPEVDIFRSNWQMRNKAVALYQSSVRKLSSTEMDKALYDYQLNLIKECLANGFRAEARAEALSYWKTHPLSPAPVYYILSVLPAHLVQHFIAKRRRRMA